MARKLKVVGVGLAAVLAVTAIFATAAQAATYHSELENTSLHGEQVTKNVFHTAAGNVKCSLAEFTGMMTGKSVEGLVLEPTYGECTAFGQSASVSTTGCWYTFTAPTPTSLFEWHWIPHIGCFAGSRIVISVPSGNCSLTIGEQIPGGVVEGQNQGSGTTRSILATPEVTGVAYTVDGPGTICGAAGAHADGEYTGSVSLKGYESTPHTGQRGIWVE